MGCCLYLNQRLPQNVFFSGYFRVLREWVRLLQKAFGVQIGNRFHFEHFFPHLKPQINVEDNSQLLEQNHSGIKRRNVTVILRGGIFM